MPALIKIRRPQSIGTSAPAPAAANASPRCVLFAAGLGELAPAALLRAAALREILGVTLHLLRVAPATTRVNMIFPGNNGADALAAAQQLENLRIETERTAERVLPAAGTLVSVRHGRFTQIVAQAAREHDALCIVLSGGHAYRGQDVAALANESGIPVLVAESARGRDIVAATDLSDPRYPVLKRGVELAVRAGASVTAVHNVEPFVATVPALVVSSGGPANAVIADPALAGAWERMGALVKSLGSDIDGVVVTRLGTADAILEVARRVSADVVVVGTRSRPWLARTWKRSVAARVVDAAARSVMVVPIAVPVHAVEAA
ncbi:MAG TPA: universal stress protein [Polyangiales bacterium]